MAFLLFLCLLALFIFSWVLWAVVVGVVFIVAALSPWGLWEFIMFLTFNNVINAVAKLPSFLGILLGFVLSLPFSAVAFVISLWTFVQTFLMAFLTFRGPAISESFLATYVSPFESEGCHHMIIARFYYEHCQWLWGGAGFMHSYYPWQNGCGKGWNEGDFWWPVGEIPIPIVIIKLFFLSLPYMFLFVFPILPTIWSLARPIAGAIARLPSVCENGDGRD